MYYSNYITQCFVFKEASPHPQIAQLASDFSDSLRSRIPKIQAVLLLGSFGNGAARIRDIMGTVEKSDLDWGIITQELTDNELIVLKDQADKVIPQLASNYGLPPTFRSCDGVNPYKLQDVEEMKPHDITMDRPDRRFQRIARPLGSIQSIHALLIEASYSSFPLTFKKFSLYIEPSYPAEVNEKNRALIKSGLDQLYTMNRGMWERVTEGLLKQWHNFRFIKDKHLLESTNISGNGNLQNYERRQAELREKISNASKILMSRPMEGFLKSTAVKPAASDTHLIDIFKHFMHLA